MAAKKGQLPFEASANLQRLIGRELVPSEEIALIELVKNAYDSGANQVVLTIQPPTEREPGYIDVQDDGEGMTLADVSRIFMFAGYSERPDQVGVSARIPTGEKGIGRFAADKLGKRLTLFTKRAGQENGIRLEVDWEAFRNKKKKFHDVKATYTVDPVAGLGQKDWGTILHISGLRSQWPRAKLESVRSVLGELIDPFHRPADFTIDLQIVGSAKLSGPIQQQPPREPDIDVHVTILSDGRVERSFRSTVDPKLDTVTLEATEQTKPLMGLTARFLYFLKRPSKALRANFQPAVRLYRDGFRVEPFASPAADWLGLSEKRAKRAGHAHIVPSRLFGFVEISRRRHPTLQDTTSRQALIDNDAARALVTLLRGQLGYLEGKIRTDVAEPRWEKSRQAKTQKLFQARYQTLSFLSLGLAHELRQPLQSIQTASENISDYLAAKSVQIPEVDAASEVIKRNVARIDKHIEFLKKIGSGNEELENIQLAQVIGQITDVFRDQAAARNINLDEASGRGHEVTFNLSALLITLTNLVMNAIQAIDTAGPALAKNISLGAENASDYTTIFVEDDGPGISDEARNRLLRRPTTTKQGGMGVALILCRDLLKMFGGDLKCTSYLSPTRFEVTIPRS